MTTTDLTEEQALAFLNQDGDLAVPCSRYGRSTYECAPVAYQAALAVKEANGEPITEESLDYLMGLVVNDHDDIAYLLGQNEITPDEVAAALDKANALGTEHGLGAASWVFDGNTPTQTYRDVLRMLDDGDPELYDQLPSAPLSGEFADSYSLRDLAEDTGIPEDSDAFSDVCDAYEDAWSAALINEVERVARYQIAEEIDPEKVLTAYIDAALWSSVDENGNPLDDSPHELSEQALKAMRLSVRQFLCFARGHLDGIDSEQIGHDFWLTRERHGTGFWDRGLPKDQADFLTELAHKFGEDDLYIGDDGKIYAS